MKLSEAIERFIDLKIEGEPTSSEWISINENYAARRAYHEELAELREAIDAARAAMENKHD